tara:strand:+ start:299 stop:487 length:189 start_codon:yes stop_codon:yes gene_type:complete
MVEDLFKATNSMEIFSQKNVAFQVVKKLPVDLIGQTSSINNIIIGINKIMSAFFVLMYFIIK